jgi:hypothetical protein
MERQRDGCDCGLVLRGGPQAHRSDSGDQHSFCKKKNQGKVSKRIHLTKREMVMASMTKGKLHRNISEETNKFLDGVMRISFAPCFISFCL